jgi:hypothetical protein
VQDDFLVTRFVEMKFFKLERLAMLDQPDRGNAHG